MKYTNRQKKIVVISSMQPFTNYTRNVAMGLAKENVELLVYAEKDKKNEEITNCGEVVPVWDRGMKFFFQVFKRLKKDNPDVVHFQQEFNMYGGLPVLTVFPFYILLIRIFRARTIVTIHAVVKRSLVDKEFVKFFKGDNTKIPPIVLRLFFQYFYWLTVRFSDKTIVHTAQLKDDLITSYSAPKDKVSVIAHAVWNRYEQFENIRENYFFYFGYLTRRKGLDNVINGFIKFIETTDDREFDLLLGGGVIKGQEFARDELLKIISEAGMQERIKYLGFLEKDEIEDYFSKSYACVVPGVITIAASGPLSHAWGYGKCVLASDVGYLSEELDDKKTGLLTKNDKWEEAFRFAVENPETIKSIESHVREKAQERSNRETAKKHLNIYFPYEKN